jgi:hypothetical protein
MQNALWPRIAAGGTAIRSLLVVDDKVKISKKAPELVGA